MAENAPGSVEALAKAFGYAPNQTADFRKRIEKGGLQLDPEKARAFAKALSEVARSNGALDAVTKKTNAQMERFFTALTNAKDQIFQSGMDDGLGYMFGSLADTIQGLAPLAKAFGAAFKGAVSLITGAIKLAITPIQLLVDSISTLWSALGGTEAWSQKVWAVIGAGGTLTLLAMKFDFIRRIIFGVNGALLAMIGNLARIAIPLLAIEDIYGSLQGKESVSGAGGVFTATNVLGSWASWMDKPISSYFSDTKVVVEVKGEEAAKFINATVSKQQQSQTAVNQSETAQ